MSLKLFSVMIIFKSSALTSPTSNPRSGIVSLECHVVCVVEVEVRLRHGRGFRARN
jgi:hypothetical protein